MLARILSLGVAHMDGGNAIDLLTFNDEGAIGV